MPGAIKAVVLAAGKGTRLKPLTETLPKVMIPVAGKPVLEYHLEQLAAAGIRDVFINLHHLAETIKAYFENGRRWGIRITYSYEPDILGTAGAVKNLEDKLGAAPFLVVYGDNFLSMDYKDFISFSASRAGIGTIGVFEKSDVRGSGILSFDKDHRVIRFKEKPREEEIFSHWVSAGVFYFQKSVMEHIKPGISDFGFNVLPELIHDGEKIFAYPLTNPVWALDDPQLLHELKAQTERTGAKEKR